MSDSSLFPWIIVKYFRKTWDVTSCIYENESYSYTLSFQIHKMRRSRYWLLWDGTSLELACLILLLRHIFSLIIALDDNVQKLINFLYWYIKQWFASFIFFWVFKHSKEDYCWKIHTDPLACWLVFFSLSCGWGVVISTGFGQDKMLLIPQKLFCIIFYL